MARTRVWVFGNVDSKVNLRKLYIANKMDEIGDKKYVVIRADIVGDFKVDGIVSNVIIPVDAIDDQGLKNAKKMIKQDLKVKIIKTLKVESHIPDPPHISHGYVTKGEIKKEEKITKKPSIEKPGRQHASPGSNKWG